MTAVINEANFSCPLAIAFRIAGPARLRRSLIIEQDSVRSAIEIVVLAARDRPEESGKPASAEQESNRNKNGKSRDHGACAFSLSAFSVTTSDDEAIATAATSGVTRPSAARGTATTL